MRSVSYAALALAISLAAPAAASDYKILDRIKMPDGDWDYGSSDLQKDVIYWVRSDHTDVFDAKTHRLSRLANLKKGHVAVVVEGTSLVVAPMRDPVDTVRIFDASADKLVADLAAGNSPDGATYDRFSKHVYSVNHRGGDVTVVDPAARKIVATIPVSGEKVEFPASDGAGHVFVNVQAAGKLAVIDVKTNKVTAKHKMAGCKGASGLAYASGARLLVAACANGVAKAMAPDGKDVATIPIGKGPDAVIYDSKAGVAFIPCGGDGVLEIIDVADAGKVAKIQTLPTQTLAKTGAIDAEGRIYLLAAQPDPAKPSEAKPGTAEMLVIGR